MIDPSPEAIDLIHSHQFLSAIRDAGYSTTPSAVSELVDNAIQANATRINIGVTKDARSGRLSLSVSDNGDGMTIDALRCALQFGGSTRFNDRSSLGRFGMGLPSAGLCLSRLIDVRTKSRFQGQALRATLDIDRTSPLQIYRTDSTFDDLDNSSGTQVILSDCDRLEFVRVGNLANALKKALARTFHYFIRSGIDIRVNDESIPFLDPLLRGPNRNLLSSRPFGSTRIVPFRIADRHAQIEIEFVELPIEDCQDLTQREKHAYGITGGAVVSVVRARREIAAGWFLTGSKRRENYDDWWRCEIRFGPELDEHFGLTFTKQGIRPSPELRRALESEIEGTARLLNKRARLKFDEMKRLRHSRSTCAAATEADSGLPPLRISQKPHSGPNRYSIEVSEKSSKALLDSSVYANHVTVKINKNHPIQELLEQVVGEVSDESGEKIRRIFDSLMLAIARTDILVDSPSVRTGLASRYRELWGAAASAIVQIR